LGVSMGDLQAVGFADGSLVKPLSGLDHVLVRIVDRVKNPIRADLENYVG
jgi:hypothetical protein